jgi:hypothetical protein
MKRRPVGYFDLEEISIGEDSIRVKVLETIPWSAYPIMESPDQAIAKNSVVSIPLWLAGPLASSSAIIPLLPKPYSPAFRHILQAGATSVKFSQYGKKFYSSGLKIAEWWPNLRIPHLLFEAFRGRLELMYSSNSSSLKHSVFRESFANCNGFEDFLDHLDENELEVYKTCIEQRKLFDNWIAGK